MNFEPSEEDTGYLASLRGFATRHLAPYYQRDDRARRMRPQVRRQLADVGVLGLRVPAEHGGQGAGALTTGLAIEVVAAADFNAAYLALLAALCAEIISGAGAGEVYGDWLHDIATGAVTVCLALTEPDHGSDAAAIEVQAVRRGDHYVLRGEKTSVSLGAQAERAVVLARTGGPGAGGVSAFYVDLDQPGVTRAPFEDLGSHAIGRAALTFDDLAVPACRRIGAEGQGFTGVMRGFDYSRALIGLMCVAAAQRSLDEAVEWARQRSAFGQPIGRFEGVAFPLVEQATLLHAARLLCLEALWRKDAGLDPAMEANMAKWWAPAVAVQAAHQALLTFGHAGYSEELPLAQRLRDLIGLEIGDGTAQIAKLVVARHLLGRDGAP